MSYKDLFTADAHNEGAEVRIKDQYGDDTSMYITVAGIDSKLWRHAKQKLEREAIAKRRGLIEQGTKIGSEDISAAVDELSAHALAEITFNWRGFKDGKKVIKFTKEKVAELYLCAPYVKDQVDLFFANRVNFTKGKATK